MPGTNASTTFEYGNFGNYGFDEMPKGVCLSLAVNPYNGLVVLRYNRNRVALEVADDLLEQVADVKMDIAECLERPAFFSDFVDYCDGDLVIDRFDPCPFCGHEPEFVVTASCVGDTSGDLVCCGGRTRIEGFDSKFEAVTFWNRRNRRVA